MKIHYGDSLTTLREIERQEDAAQAMQIQKERLEQLRERFGIELRRQGLGALLDARPGDRLCGFIAVECPGGEIYWCQESD